MADAWNDLEKKQLFSLMKVLHSEDINPVQLQLRIWKIISSLKWYQFFSLPHHFILNTLHLTDFVFKKNRLTSLPFHRFKKKAAPAANFDNLKMKEFVFSEQYHKLFNETEDINYLNKLIAVLFRPENKTHRSGDDRREALNENEIPMRAKEIAQWPKAVKWTILTWYSACKKALVEENKEVFSGAGSEGGSDESSMLSIMRTIAKDGTYGDFDKVEDLYVKTMMLELRERVKEGKEQKRRLKTS